MSTKMNAAVSGFAADVARGIDVLDAFRTNFQAVTTDLKDTDITELFKDFSPVEMSNQVSTASYDYIKLMGYNQGQGSFLDDIINNIESGNAEEVIKLTK